MIRVFVKFFIVKLWYPIIYPGSQISSYIGFRKSQRSEGYLTIRDNVRFYGNTKIGAFSLINSDFVASPLLKSIGRFTSIGPNVYIGPGNHNYNQTTSRGVPAISRFLNLSIGSELNKRLILERNMVQKDTVIGHDVWIGGHSVILNGVTVGQGAVVGANSVVTKDVEPYSVVAGVPAKVIKYRFDKSTINELLDVDFYNKSLDEITAFWKNHPNAMVDVNDFISLFKAREE